jgi:hypothetical protein
MEQHGGKSRSAGGSFLKIHSLAVGSKENKKMTEEQRMCADAAQQARELVEEGHVRGKVVLTISKASAQS